MKISLQYVSDSNGKPLAVQMPVTEWKKVLAKLKKYEQLLQIRTDLKEAFQQVEILRKTKSKKQTLTDFLNEDFIKKIQN
jgi:hypothetical protein